MNLRSGKVLSGTPVPKRLYEKHARHCFGTSSWPSLDEARALSITGSLEFNDFISYCGQILDLIKDTDVLYKKRLYVLAIAESLFKLDKELLGELSVFIAVMVHKLENASYDSMNPSDLIKYIQKVRKLYR